jgi:hypothetical protein
MVVVVLQLRAIWTVPKPECGGLPGHTASTIARASRPTATTLCRRRQIVPLLQ